MIKVYVTVHAVGVRDYIEPIILLKHKSARACSHRLITRTGIENAMITFHHPCNAFSAFNVLPLRSFAQHEADAVFVLTIRRYCTVLLRIYAIDTRYHRLSMHYNLFTIS